MATGSASAESRPLLEARSIGVTREGARLLDKIDFDIATGELIGVIGPNGAGKSTLLGVLAGLDTADSGHVLFEGVDLAKLRDRERAREIAWMDQLAAPHWPVSVEHLVMLGRIPHLSAWQTPSDTDQHAVHEALQATDCNTLMGRRVDTLSGGELTRVMLARTLAAEPRLLFADEPIAALDIGHQLQTMDVLRNFARGPRSAVVVLHDLTLAARYCDRLVLLQHGTCVAAGDHAVVLSEDNIRRVYGVDIVKTGPEGTVLYPVRRSDV